MPAIMLGTMSLSTADLQSIKEIVRDGTMAIENDVKDIYTMLSKMKKDVRKLKNHSKVNAKNISVIANHVNVDVAVNKAL